MRKHQRHFRLRRIAAAVLPAACAALLAIPACGQSITEPHKEKEIDAGSAVCKFDVTSAVSYEKGQITFDPPSRETQPITMYFSGLYSRHPKIRSVDAAGKEGEPRPLRSFSTQNKVVLIEITPDDRNVFVYTIDRRTGVGTWSKQYEIRSVPLGLISMGQCE